MPHSKTIFGVFTSAQHLAIKSALEAGTVEDTILAPLTTRDLIIFRSAYGTDGTDGMSNEAIGKLPEVDLSNPRISTVLREITRTVIRYDELQHTDPTAARALADRATDSTPNMLPVGSFTRILKQLCAATRINDE
jgi:hypothetical protein